jgi:hypothetical protein
MNARIYSIIIALLIEAPVAWSQGTLAWHFNSTSFVAQSTDPIPLAATITNASDMPYVIDLVGSGIGGSEIVNFFDVDWNTGLHGETVPAYGTLLFNYGTLLPWGGYVPPGTYHETFADLWFSSVDTIFLPSQNTFQILIIPEPTPIVLTVVGLACFYVMKLVNRRRRVL